MDITATPVVDVGLSDQACTPFVIEAHFLDGRIMAASKDDRSAPEWPIQPSRLFSALVAALHGLDERSDAFADGEAAVRWVETIGPPEVHAAREDGVQKTLAYVPFNDIAIGSEGKTKGLETCLPDSPRRKKAREFPGVSVGVPIIRYVWHVDPAQLGVHRMGLQRLLSRIAYLGRSVNFVIMRMLEISPAELPFADQLECWLPCPNGTERMRTVAPGRLDRLRILFQSDKVVDHGPITFYRRASENSESAEEVDGVWSRFLTTFAFSPARIHAADTEGVAKAVRRALISRASSLDTGSGTQGPIDPFISGHNADGSPARIDRVAVIPLANIMNEYADGRVLGFAIAMPVGASPEQWALVSQLLYGDGGSIPPLTQIRIGDTMIGVEEVRRSRVQGLSAKRYVGLANTWTTVTPILLSRRPDHGRVRKAWDIEAARTEAQIALDCVACGLPRPHRVEASQVSPLDGVGHARSYRQQRNGPPRWATHATIYFDAPVWGPMLVGAGRFNGLGLLIPWRADTVRSPEA